MTSSDYQPTQRTTVKTMPCCIEEAKLVIPVRGGVKLHERDSPTCGMTWTFATDTRVIPLEELSRGEDRTLRCAAT